MYKYYTSQRITKTNVEIIPETQRVLEAKKAGNGSIKQFSVGKGKVMLLSKLFCRNTKLWKEVKHLLS